MKTALALTLALFAAAPLFAAEKVGEAKTKITAAAKALAAQPNYAWTATPQFAAGSSTWKQGPTEGVTEKDGPALARFTLGDSDIELAFLKGRGAINYDGDWRGEGDLDGDLEWVARRLRAYKIPAAEAEWLARDAQDWKAEDGAWRATITDDAVKEILARGRRGGESSGRKGWVKLWVKDGQLTKYEYNVQAKAEKDNGEELNVNVTTTVEIKDVGKAKVKLPAAAAGKLS